MCRECVNIHGKEVDPLDELQCREVCGDGFNVGELECDDGNSFNEDGCSSDCMVEECYTCSGGNELNKDTCVDICSPICNIEEITPLLTVLVVCNEPVILKATKNDFAVRFQGPRIPYLVDYELGPEFTRLDDGQNKTLVSNFTMRLSMQS